MRESKEAGIILLSTICIMAVMSLLIVTSLQQQVLYARVLGRLQAHDKDLYHLEKLGLKLLAMKRNACLIKSVPGENVWAQMPIKGCSVEQADRHYQYLIEDAGIFSCWMINTKDGLKASRHFRLLLRQSDEEGREHYLQLRDIQAVESLEPCEDEKQIIQGGIHGWQYG